MAALCCSSLLRSSLRRWMKLSSAFTESPIRVRALDWPLHISPAHALQLQVTAALKAVTQVKSRHQSVSGRCWGWGRPRGGGAGRRGVQVHREHGVCGVCNVMCCTCNGTLCSCMCCNLRYYLLFLGWGVGWTLLLYGLHFLGSKVWVKCVGCVSSGFQMARCGLL